MLKVCKEERKLRKTIIDKAHSVRMKANFSLHAKDKYIVISEKEAFSVVRDTFQILEEIYKQLTKK